MDKYSPTYNLKQVKRLIVAQQIEPIHLSAWTSASAIGFSQIEAYEEILNLQKQHFYKSVSEYSNPKVWQDVYKKDIRGVLIYIKFKITEDGKFLLTSFKEA